MLLRKILFQRLHVKGLILFLSLLSAVLGLLSPYFQKIFVDSVMGIESPIPTLSASPLFSLAATFVLALAGQFLGTWATLVGIKESVHVQKELSEPLYEKML